MCLAAGVKMRQLFHENQELAGFGGYHIIMRVRTLFRYLLALILFAIPAAAQNLPDLGDPAQATFTPAQEKRVGENIMREIRADATYHDDAEVTDYINRVGNRLVTRGTTTRQEFEFFMMRDPQINAFALPGGYIGVHTGLLLAAQSESELAGVMAHEIAHVTQRHIARMVTQQQGNQWLSLAALAVAILAARSNSQVGEAAVAFGQAAIIQSQLNFSRDYEREADRVGLQLLDKAGFDPRGMEAFFERLQRATRFYEGAPSYLRTHPLTHERIADIQNRAQDLPYRQVLDTLDFHLMRAKLKVEFDPPREAVAYYRDSLAERRFLSEPGARYGLVAGLVRMRDFADAKRELAALREQVKGNATVETLACRVSAAAGEQDAAFACYREALRQFPGYRTLVYEYADALLIARQPDAALKVVDARMQTHTEDHRLYLLQSRAYALQNKRFAQHRAQAEAYARMGNLTGAVEQLQIALKAGEGDFYQLSATEARLRQLRALDAERRKESAANK
jgi:predicted Zn-dependent protease